MLLHRCLIELLQVSGNPIIINRAQGLDNLLLSGLCILLGEFFVSHSIRIELQFPMRQPNKKASKMKCDLNTYDVIRVRQYQQRTESGIVCGEQQKYQLIEQPIYNSLDSEMNWRLFGKSICKINSTFTPYYQRIFLFLFWHNHSPMTL